MKRSTSLWLGLTTLFVATPLQAQEAVREGAASWLLQIVLFIVSIPYTLYLVFVDGQRMHLLPAPLIGLWVCIWSFREWRRQRYWTPRLVPIMSVLALATIILINVDWVMNGGEMWTQRYVVIAIFGLFPYIAYIVLGGPRLIGRSRSGVAFEASEGDSPSTESGAAEAAGWSDSSDVDEFGLPVSEDGGVPLPWAPERVRMEGPWWVKAMAIGVVGIAGFLIFGGPRVLASDLRADLAVLRHPEQLVPDAAGTVLGNPGAPISIFVFGDYQCAACAAFSTRFRPMLDSAYIADEEARIVFFDRPFRNRHPHAVLAARAAYCAGEQDAFWPYHTALFALQEEWTDLESPRESFERYAEEGELELPAFRECLDSGRHAERVAANEALAEELGIVSTPTIIVARRGGDPRRAPAYTFQAIERTILEVTARGAS